MCIIHGFSINNKVDVGEISFLSSSNLTATYIFPALCASFLYANHKGQKYNILSLILYAGLVLTELMLWSATSLTGVVLLLAYILFIYNKKYEKYVNCTILHVLAIILLIGFTTGIMQIYFSYIIEEILHKDITMTGRINNWQIGITGFWQHPLLGCGHNAMTIDNSVIQILYRGGLLGLMFFVITYIVGAKRLFNKKENRSIDKFFVILLITILIMSISESWTYFVGFYIILSLIYCSSFIDYRHSK
jgi:O-antigen ligase